MKRRVAEARRVLAEKEALHRRLQATALQAAEAKAGLIASELLEEELKTEMLRSGAKSGKKKQVNFVAPAPTTRTDADDSSNDDSANEDDEAALPLTFGLATTSRRSASAARPSMAVPSKLPAAAAAPARRPQGREGEIEALVRDNIRSHVSQLQDAYPAAAVSLDELVAAGRRAVVLSLMLRPTAVRTLNPYPLPSNP